MHTVGNEMQTLLTGAIKVTLQREKKRKLKRALLLRDAPRKPTAGRDGSGARFVNGSVVCLLDCVEWRKRGASSCHEARNAQHGLPIALMGYK